MRTRDIMRLLGAHLVAGGGPESPGVCTNCGRRPTGWPASKPAICAACSAAELGTTAYALALAVEFHLSIKVCEARLERFGPPSVSPKEWLTPRSRLRY
jgi:hypothetical protein